MLPISGRVVEALRRSTAQVRVSAREGEHQGSAIVLNADQLITNAHVVSNDRPLVESWEGKTVSAKVVKVDRRRDLALLAAPGLNAPPAELGDSDLARAGMAVVAVGSPFGFTGAVSSGVVHSADRRWVRATVRLAPGNSGGPLANSLGQVIGINTMVVMGGPAMAIPSRAVNAFVSRALSGRVFGITLRPVRLRSGGNGLVILEVAKDGAADRASLLPGDILLSADGRRLEDADNLEDAMDSAELLHVEFQRGGNSRRHVVVRLLPERITNAA